MNYYDELIDNLNQLINDHDYEKAKAILLNELDLAYVPRDIEEKLYEYLSIIKSVTNSLKSLSDEEIVDYLYKDNNHQLLAIEELNKRNIRDYLDICFKYLKSNGFKNAKVLLIDSLIRQEIDYEFEFVDDNKSINFNPKHLKVIELTDGFISCNKMLNDTYMKEPSKLQIGMELLYKECLLYLPKQANNAEGEILVSKIINYIDKAFDC